MKKKTNWTAIVIVALVIIGILLYTGKLNITRTGDGGIDIDIDLSAQRGQAADNGDIEGDKDSSSIDVCQSFTENYPTYFFVREQNCHLAGGSWLCKRDKLGCYDITFWDHATMCGTNEIQVLKGMCTTLGGKWTCTATEVSCELL